MQINSTEDLQKLAGLRLALHNVCEEMKTIAALAEQLANDDVEFALIVNMHNKTTCEENKKRYRVRTLTEDHPFGIQIPYRANHSKCSIEYAFPMDEPRALQIINLILQQKQVMHDQIKKQLENILQVNQTPIQILHSK